MVVVVVVVVVAVIVVVVVVVVILLYSKINSNSPQIIPPIKFNLISPFLQLIIGPGYNLPTFFRIAVRDPEVTKILLESWNPLRK